MVGCPTTWLGSGLGRPRRLTPQFLGLCLRFGPSLLTSGSSLQCSCGPGGPGRLSPQTQGFCLPCSAGDPGNPPDGVDVGLQFGPILLQVDSSCIFMYPAAPPWSGRAWAAVTPDTGIPCSCWSTPLAVLRPGGAWRLTFPAWRVMGCIWISRGGLLRS